MKKLLFFALSFAFTAALTVQADDEKWTPFQAAFFPNFPSYSYNSNVNGIKSGWPMCSGIGKVKGLEISWFYSGTDHINGAQLSWISCANKDLYGAQGCFIFNYSESSLIGVQASFVNVSGDVKGLQASAFNYSGNMHGFQPGLIGNISEDLNGCQMGIFNVANKTKGFQAGAVNAADELNGMQLGVVNTAKNRGVQFGLVNYIEGGVLPVFPLFNFSM